MTKIIASVTLADIQRCCQELSASNYLPSRRKITTAIDSGHIPSIRSQTNRITFRFHLMDEIASKLNKLGEGSVKK